MYPGCFDCGPNIGCFNDGGPNIGNLLDGNPSTGGATAGDMMPYVTFDLGFERTDVRYVNLTARGDADLYQSNMRSMYFSNAKAFSASARHVLIRGSITFRKLGEQISIATTKGVSGRCVTVMRSNTNMVGRWRGCGPIGLQVHAQAGLAHTAEA
jgi:hypothetical protein